MGVILNSLLGAITYIVDYTYHG